ncbi:hypothetical protein GCM10027516_27120 [Niabella aquatica]
MLPRRLSDPQPAGIIHYVIFLHAAIVGIEQDYVRGLITNNIWRNLPVGVLPLLYGYTLHTTAVFDAFN